MRLIKQTISPTAPPPRTQSDQRVEEDPSPMLNECVENSHQPTFTENTLVLSDRLVDNRLLSDNDTGVLVAADGAD